jgi:hypothetical protein
MRLGEVFGVLFCCASMALAGLQAGCSEGVGEAAVAPRMRGVCLEAARPLGPDDLRPIHDLGADWISQTPFGWVRSLNAPEVILASGHRTLWGESDSGLVQTARLARGLGIKTLLKPHLWVRHAGWPGELAMQSDADWQAWFHSYETFILHYAQLAENSGMEALAVGTELSRTTGHTQEWRRIIARVRAVYHGSLTYCANWSEEAEAVEFWSDLDFIGVQAYYPLSKTPHPRPEELRPAWAPFVASLESLSKRTGKRIVFTEVGYKSVAGALAKPWEWEGSGPPDVELQRQAYQALFETFWNRSWFGGTFIWKWHTWAGAAQEAGSDFTPQGKPALEVIRTYYTSAPKPPQPAKSTN